MITLNSVVSNYSLTSSNQSFHQLLCLRSALSKNINGKLILACLILAENLHDTTGYTDLLFPLCLHTLDSVLCNNASLLHEFVIVEECSLKSNST